LDYNAGFTANRAWLCAHGLSTGAALPDSEFPPKSKRNESLDVITTEREFFVVAKRIGTAAESTEMEVTIWNRSRWPARVSTNLSFRYFFTLDGDTKAEQVQATVTGNDKAKISSAKALAGKTAYVEVSFPGEAIYPGNLTLASRTVKLRLTAPGWDAANDWSANGLSQEAKLAPRLAVYDGGRVVGGEEPGQEPK
jgi:endoglucanase